MSISTLYHFGHGETSREIALHPKLVFPAVYCDRTRQVSDPHVDWCKRTGSSFRNVNQLFQNI